MRSLFFYTSYTVRLGRISQINMSEEIAAKIWQQYTLK
jgi:hypothetical protein